ncbi:molybdopterin-dependent oxidoreductase [Paraburkholderia sp.]|uniref:molybdopterin-dependent oxidoreductase n=1 Tax=Paraburkholderia sp. TaxID=1926495 RepID=UPI0039C97E4F
MHYYKRGARWIAGLAIALMTTLVAPDAPAATLSLDVMGKIAITTDPSHTVYHFTQAQLLAMPAHSITTSTEWTARSTFTGPSLADILKHVGAQGTEIEVRTLDDYTDIIPLSDIDRYGVIMAYSMNGKRLKVSDFGPLFLIYPRDNYPTELTGADANAKFVWQIKALIVK